jgi:2-C-methyl-D-erythritol 4-phosphate cytidylyltransferase
MSACGSGSSMKVTVILPAAGLGTRMGRSVPEKAGTSRKQFMLLDGSPILLHTIRKFASTPAVSEIVVALRGDDIEWVRELLRVEKFDKTVRLVEGGDSRQESVEHALATLDPATELVAVHDAVRPFIEHSVLEKVFAEAEESGAAIVGIVPVDTVKQVHRNKIRQTIPRDRLILAQTPQVFRFDLLKSAFAKAREDNFAGTDESSLVERLDQVEVSVVPGSDRNLKITKPSDMDLARLFLAEEMTAKVGS